jgi:uncharacterized surface protein with fasciclin (FAS1) repeats
VLVASAFAGALVLAAAACGGSSPSQPVTGASSHPMHHVMHHVQPMHEPAFGPGCGMIPRTGMGSLHGMMTDPVATAVMHNPLLASFAAGLKTAGLAADIDSMHAVTIFAPSDSAFHKLSAHDMSMMHSAAGLARILKYHIVNGRVTPAKLASGMALPTLEGGVLHPARMGSVYEVNKAHVVCGNIQTANATVYIIDSVLVPMH